MHHAFGSLESVFSSSGKSKCFIVHEHARQATLGAVKGSSSNVLRKHNLDEMRQGRLSCGLCGVF